MPRHSPPGLCYRGAKDDIKRPVLAVIGHVAVYQGKGEHIAMPGPQESLMHNTVIINKIFSDVDNE
ncbi:hypothetical protein CLV51_102837 [Chitinophaga niastensis]|uniref:Uncharacterized protein n=2 Tax=Chitinophaga niastensis TaxID=536980 RepID=A0A2P8HP68_CHINA|nr:hypothetical protein CLV51_102837 [Chitinophaga niastensis]